MRHTLILPNSFDPLEFLTTLRLRMRADGRDDAADERGVV
jgi:hypothetical protein